MKHGAKIWTKTETEKKVCNGCIEVCNGFTLIWKVMKRGVPLHRKPRVGTGNKEPMYPINNKQ